MTLRIKSYQGEENPWWVTNSWWSNFTWSFNTPSSNIPMTHSQRYLIIRDSINQHLEKYDAKIIDEESCHSDGRVRIAEILEFKDEESYMAFVLEWS